jgi:hypothetical protein
MSCNLTAGIRLGCRDNSGGVANAWLTDYTNIASITKNSGDTITSISGSGTYFAFELIRTSSSFTETVNPSLPNGTIFYTQDLITYFAKLSQDKRNILKTLGQSPKLSVVVEDNNGNYFLLGEVYGMTVSAGSSVTGKALGDPNGYNITFQAFEQNPMNQLAGTLASVATGITVQSI